MIVKVQPRIIPPMIEGGPWGCRDPRIWEEVVAMERCSGISTIPDIIEVFEDYYDVCIVMTRAPGDTLYDARHKVTECRLKARRLLSSLSHTIAECQDRKIAHLDISPSNLMYDTNTEQLTLIDFGMARCYEGRRMPMSLMSPIGTIPFIPPEVFHHQIHANSDVWSMGMIASLVLTNAVPVHIFQESKKRTVDDILAMEDTNAVCKHLTKFSHNLANDEAEFIRICLHMDPDTRPHARDLPWLS